MKELFLISFICLFHLGCVNVWDGTEGIWISHWALVWVENVSILYILPHTKKHRYVCTKYIAFCHTKAVHGLRKAILTNPLAARRCNNFKSVISKHFMALISAWEIALRWMPENHFKPQCEEKVTQYCQYSVIPLPNFCHCWIECCSIWKQSTFMMVSCKSEYFLCDWSSVRCLAYLIHFADPLRLSFFPVMTLYLHLGPYRR